MIRPVDFFWTDTPCLLCGHGTSIHVGRLRDDDTFCFHGLLAADNPLETKAILSRTDWRYIFMTRRGVLRKEDGERVDFPMAWVDSLSPAKPEVLHLDEDAALDAEGFHVHVGDFL